MEELLQHLWEPPYTGVVANGGTLAALVGTPKYCSCCDQMCMGGCKIPGSTLGIRSSGFGGLNSWGWLLKMRVSFLSVLLFLRPPWLCSSLPRS